MGDLVKFPIHKIRKPKTDLATKQTKEKAQEIKENIFIEQIVEGLTLNLIHTLQENGVNMKKVTFLRDLAVVIEGVKSLLDSTPADPLEYHVRQRVTATVTATPTASFACVGGTVQSNSDVMIAVAGNAPVMVPPANITSLL